MSHGPQLTIIFVIDESVNCFLKLIVKPEMFEKWPSNYPEL